MSADDFFEDDEPVDRLLAEFDSAQERGVTGNHVCVPVTNDAGEVIARARVSPDLGEEGTRALRQLVEAAIRLQAQQDAADPEGAADRARRYEQGRQRILARRRQGGDL